MRQGRSRLSDAQRQWIRNWWRALQPRRKEDDPLPAELWAMGRGERAQLRRCENAEELLAHAATLLLAERMIALGGSTGILPDQAISYERMAWVAGVLAAVKEDTRDNQSLAWHLGNGANNERPKMSELRFLSMHRSAAISELFRHWRRAIQLANGSVDIARLAEDLLCWQLEMDFPPVHASKATKFRWAHDYYLSKREQAAATEPESNKELNP